MHTPKRKGWIKLRGRLFGYIFLGVLLMTFILFDFLRVHHQYVSGTTSSAAQKPATANPSPQSAASPVPGVNLTNWYLTLPVTCAQANSSACKGDANGAGEIFQPALATYASANFYADTQNGQYLFRADVEGVTTSGSNYPRAELREMINNGTQHASWSTANGVNSMVTTEAVLHLPVVKPQIVTAQIHNDTGEVIEVLAEALQPGVPTENSRYRICVRFGPNGGNETGPCLDNDYVLGSYYTIEVTASNGVIRIWYAKGTNAPNTAQPSTWQEPYVGVGNYFKAGVYTQSNLHTGDKTGAYGEVAIRKLVVMHQ